MSKIELLEDENYLNTKEDIREYLLEDCPEDFFDCGAGSYEDEAEKFVKTNDGKYYKAKLFAEIGKNRHDCGEDSFYVNSIEKVEIEETTYEEVKKSLNGEVLYKIACLSRKIDELKKQIIN